MLGIGSDTYLHEIAGKLWNQMCGHVGIAFALVVWVSLSSLLRFTLMASLLCVSACEQGLASGDGNEDKSDLIDEAPRGKTSLGLELDLINQFSFALWENQALKVAADESVIPDELMRGDLAFLPSINLWLDVSGEAKLPPVLDTNASGFRVGVGEFVVDLRGGTDLGQLSAKAVLAIQADIDVSVRGSRLVLTPRFDKEDIHIDLQIQSFAGLKAEAVERMVEGMAPEFVSRLLQRIESFPIPSMDLKRSGFDRVLGLNEAVFKLSPNGAIMEGTLGDVNPDDIIETVLDQRAPLSDTAPALASCEEPAPATPGLEGDCCFADDGSGGVCTNLDPDADGTEESFCPTGKVALRRKCPSAPGHVKCCIFPES